MDFGRTSPADVSAHLRIDCDFEALASFISDGIVYLGGDGLVRAWSSGAAAITGIPRIEAVGGSLEELFARMEPPLGFSLVPQPTTVWTKDENRRALHATIMTIEDGWLVSFGRQSTFDAIEQLKNEIVTAVSHELKTPIATIKAYATTMRENPDATAPKLTEYLETIEEEADRLSSAVDDLLLAGRVDAEHLVTQRRAVPVGSIVQHVCERLGPTAAARIECTAKDVIVDADPELLADALMHLVENGLKFSTESTKVTIDAERSDRDVSIRVIDRGIGVGEEHIPYIFERFYRAERNLVSSTGGAGLGLFIARAVARAHGGSIGVETKVHQGATFTMRLPVRA
ncbi:MAG TPA: HAMP domain-containing sensor histidine kinase [Candidatus Aquilonibacter sp.]|nr:HAMP domain-containing sensor histidine kinase [Candidatus Aquilonibacter sp.]